MDKGFAYETLLQIAGYLKDDQKTLLQLSRTCHKLHSLCTPFLFKSPQFTTFQGFELFAKTLSIENGVHVRDIDLHMVPHRWDPKTNDLLYILSEKTPNLEILNLELCYKLTNKALKRITKPLHDLRILSVDQCETIGDDSIEQVIENCPYLQELYLGSTHITDNSLNLIATKLILLTHLYIAGCRYVSEIGVNKVIRECKTLQRLVIKDCSNVVGDFGLSMRHFLDSNNMDSHLSEMMRRRSNASIDFFDSFEIDNGWEDVEENEDEEEDLYDGDRPPAYFSH